MRGFRQLVTLTSAWYWNVSAGASAVAVAAHTALCRKAACCCAAAAGHAPHRGRAAEGRRALHALGWKKTLQGRGTARGSAGAEVAMLAVLRLLADPTACGAQHRPRQALQRCRGRDTYCLLEWLEGACMIKFCRMLC